MTVNDILNRLERLRKTRDGWAALCPAHADREPSLSIGVGDGGQTLVRCFAGCTVESVVEALGISMSDLFPDPPVARSGDVQRALELPPVAEWLAARGFPPGEIARMHALVTAQGAAVVFRYLGPDGGLLYEKIRPIGAKKFWRRPRGTESVLYGLPDLDEGDDSRVIVVEGELDAHALWALDIHPVVSVPDGCGSRLDADKLAPLARFREVIIATDADGPGDELAGRLARALGPERCRRARFVSDAGKDANDALKAGWTGDRVQELLAGAPPWEQLALSSPAALSQDDGDIPAPTVVELSRRYQVIDGRICYVRTDRKGNGHVETLANFVAQVDEEVTYDDGAEIRREFRIGGRLDDGQALPAARVNAAEFSGLTWVTREWGIRAVVSAGQGTKDHLRTAIQHLSVPRRRRIYRHTGWIECEGRSVFLFQGGAVGADGIEVDLPPPLDRFALPAQVDDLADALRWSLRLLDCGPLEVTVPLLAAVYLSPIASILNPDVTVWLHGASGSLKSTLSALAQGHFGDFDRKTLSGSWTSTENSLENRLFILKDVLSVIDDYAPQADPRAQRELDRRVQRVIRNVGNRAGRGRLSSDLTARPDRPPRGFLLCNGEELPPGLSINARLVPVEVERRSLDLAVITQLQENAHRLRHAMRGFIEWLAARHAELKRELPLAREQIRRDMQRGSAHLRQPEALANLFVGLDVFLRFCEQAGALDASGANTLRERGQHALRSLAVRQAQGLSELHPSEVFIEVLNTLLIQGKVRFAESADAIPAAGDPELIGWKRGDTALLLSDAIYHRVAIFIREQGGHWGPSPRELHRELVEREYLLSTGDGRDAGQWRVGPERKKKRGWLLRLGRLDGAAVSRPSSARLHDSHEVEEDPDEAKQLEFQENSAADSEPPPKPPIRPGVTAEPGPNGLDGTAGG